MTHGLWVNMGVAEAFIGEDNLHIDNTPTNISESQTVLPPDRLHGHREVKK